MKKILLILITCLFASAQDYIITDKGVKIEGQMGALRPGNFDFISNGISKSYNLFEINEWYTPDNALRDRAFDTHGSFKTKFKAPGGMDATQVLQTEAIKTKTDKVNTTLIKAGDYLELGGNQMLTGTFLIVGGIIVGFVPSIILMLDPKTQIGPTGLIFPILSIGAIGTGAAFEISGAINISKGGRRLRGEVFD